MSKQEIISNEIPQNDVPFENDASVELKKLIDEKPEAAIVCEAKENNPNYLSIVYSNKSFYEIFGVSEYNLIGKSYDFLFADLDLNYSSEDQMEYVRLIKAVKDFHQASIIISISDQKAESTKIRLKVTFSPNEADRTKLNRHAIFTFEKIELGEKNFEEFKEGGNKSSVVLLRNLERTLRNERLLREVGNLIISDLPIEEVAQSISKILCKHLKTDRCLIHDYQNGETNFVVEHHNTYSRAMFNGVEDQEGLNRLTKYINFQNHFYEKFGNKTKKSSLSIIDDVATDPNFAGIAEICSEFLIASQIAVTTTFNGHVNGGIYLHQSEKRSWTEDEIELIEVVADQFSIALDRSVSIERVMVTNHALIEKTSELKEALKHEQEMRKMQNEFVALVSHEFKTPLQIIDSTRELISRKIRNYNIADEALEKSLERIKSGIQRMNGLIHSTLNLARMESGDSAIHVENVTFDLRKFVSEIIEKNSNLTLNKNIKIITKIHELPEEFIGDPKLLDHSITNVISNAIKYSKNNSVVKILAKSNDKKVALRVIDEGIGIPKEDLENVGQKFFRAKNTLSVAGTGIGLYLTKHFIELHGGNVLIESEANVGTSVTIILPRTK